VAKLVPDRRKEVGRSHVEQGSGHIASESFEPDARRLRCALRLHGETTKTASGLTLHDYREQHDDERSTREACVRERCPATRNDARP
jgi:hypothetical protein